MRKMKDSGIEWIGEIPEDWEVGRVKNIAELISGYAFDSEDLNIEGKNIVIRIGDIKDGSVDIENANKTNFNDEVLSFFQVKNNDVLIAMSGATVGKLGYVNFTPKNTYINQRVGILRSSFSKFLYYALSTNKFIEYILLESIGSAQPNISNDGIKNYPLCIPSLPEQQRIADFLDDKVSQIDSVISKTRETIEEYKKLKQSIITEVVTGKVKIENGKVCGKYDTYKDSGIEWIGEIPSEWKITKIKHEGIARNGLTYTPTDVCDKEEGELVLRSSNIQNNKLILDDCVFVNTKINNELYVKENDILICSRNGSPKLIGKNALIPANLRASFGAFMLIYRCKIPFYIRLVLNSDIFSYYLGNFLTVSVNQLTIGNFNEIQFPLPPKQEQDKILMYLNRKCSEIDNLITKKEQLVVELEAYKKSLIYEVVTGKRSV